jgi:hypothetical protein
VVVVLAVAVLARAAVDQVNFLQAHLSNSDCGTATMLVFVQLKLLLSQAFAA